MTRPLHRLAALFVAGNVMAAGAPVHAQVQILRPTTAAAGDEAKGGFVQDAQQPDTTSPAPSTPLSPEVRDTLQRINSYRAAGATCGSQRVPHFGA